MDCGQKGSWRGTGLHGLLWAAVMLLLAAATCRAQEAAAAESPRQAAFILEQEGRNAEAEAAWRSYLGEHPSSSEAYAHLGLLEARQQHYEKAIPLYRKALALHSTLPGLHLNLGLAYFKAGKMKEALEEFSALLTKSAPSSPEQQRLVILVGMCHYGLGEFAQAAPYLQKAVSHEPHNSELLLALAQSYLWSKQYKQVMLTYHAMLQINMESAEADMLAGEALDAMKDEQGALQQFRAAVRADPKLPEVHFGLGYLLWTQHELPQAAAEFKAELENDPGDAQALTYLGDCDMRLGDSQKGALLLRRAIQANPKIELAYLDLGIMDADAGRRKMALQEMLAAAKIAPNDANVDLRLGRLYMAMGDKEKAKAEFEKTSKSMQSANARLVDMYSAAKK